MSRTGEKMKEWEELITRLEVECPKPFALFHEMEEFFKPPVVRTSFEALKQAWSEMGEHLRGLEINTDINVPELMRAYELDPSVRSDLKRTNQFLVESGHMRVIPGSKARTVVARIGNGTAGNANATAGNANATAEAEAAEAAD